MTHFARVFLELPPQGGQGTKSAGLMDCPGFTETAATLYLSVAGGRPAGG